MHSAIRYAIAVCLVAIFGCFSESAAAAQGTSSVPDWPRAHVATRSLSYSFAGAVAAAGNAVSWMKRSRCVTRFVARSWRNSA